MTIEDDLAKLAVMLKVHVEAVNTGDVEGVLDHYTDDVVYLGLAPIRSSGKMLSEKL